MTQIRPIEELFADLVALKTMAEREAYLDEVCGNDEPLRGRLNKLLAANEKAGSFLRDGHSVDATEDLAHEARLIGSTIGPYKLREVIGEGGMGTVYVASQEKPLRRKVALKVIKAGMDSKAVIARFEAERNALAMMSHPNIAKVLDAGTTEQGRPFFAMELVNGIPITEFCDEHKLSIEQRLELFVQVCQAIQHAHQKGIIHRDIKPSNVLVTELDGKPIPKVIDFGVAKALNQNLTDRSIYTGFQTVIGTPLYMSPEQASLSAVDVDTRSDVYSLGVLLYELLTGTTPFEQSKLKEAAQHEVLRIIREEEPPRPSNRISTLGKTVTRISQQRGTQPDRLGRLVKGDLDWIVMTALAKERSRRYESASRLADDIHRHLAREPVVARAPTTAYRLSTYVRRNRVALTVVGIIFVLMAVSLAALSYGLYEKNQREIRLFASVLQSIREHIALVQIREAEELLAVAEENSRADVAEIAKLKAQVAILNEDYKYAAELLRPLVEQDPEDIALKSMLAMVDFRRGDEDKLIEAMNELKDMQPDASDFDGLLYRGWLFSTYFPDKALPDLEAARDLKRYSLLAILKEAQAYRHQAELATDPTVSLDALEKALLRLAALELTFPKSDEIVTNEVALCYICKACRHEELGELSERDQCRTRASQAIDKLDPNLFDGRYTRAIFHIMMNDFAAIVRDYEALKAKQKISELGDWYLMSVAVAYFALGKDFEAKDVLAFTNRDYQVGPARRIFAYASLANSPADEIVRELQSKSKKDLSVHSSFLPIYDWAVYRLLGRQAEADVELQLVRAKARDAWWEGLTEITWWAAFADYMNKAPGGRRPTNLVEGAGGQRGIGRASLHFALGVDCLAEGRREDAKRHFEEGARVHATRAVANWLCLAFRQRMELDQSWPPPPEKQ